jgi:hypothetical protein
MYVFFSSIQFIDAAISECRSIASRCGLAPHEIPVAFYVENEPWSVRIVLSLELEM